MGFHENINTIKEIFPGHYQIILDFASNKFLEHAIDDSYKYVWVYEHSLSFHPNSIKDENNDTWNNYSLPLFSGKQNFNLIARHISFDFVLPTAEFKKLLPQFPQGIFAVQLNNLPEHYLNSKTMKDKTFYDLLKKECDYLFEFRVRNVIDYGTIISSNKEYLEKLLVNPSIDWKNLRLYH